MSALIETLTEREQWLLDRDAYLGGTDIAAIAGKHKYKTALGVYGEKVLGIKDESSDPILRMMGLALEPVIKWKAEQDLKTEIQPGFKIMHPDFDFLGGNPDGATADDLIEFKTYDFSTASEWGEPWTDNVPDAYHVQGTFYCGLTGKRSVIICALNRSTAKVDYWRVEANQTYYEALVQIGVQFRERHWLPKLEPRADSAIDLPLVRAIYREQKVNDMAIAEAEHDEDAAKYIELHKLVSDGKKQCDRLKSRLIQAVGDHQGIRTASGLFTYKPRVDGVRVFKSPTA